MEILISIALFSIIMVFLYEVLDSNDKHNKQYERIINNKISNFALEDILLQDFLNSEGNITISEDKNNNSRISFKTSNTYHNPFYTFVSYFIVQEDEKNQLIRLESQELFDKKKINTIISSSYIDIVSDDINKFVVTKDKENKKNIFYIEFKDTTSLLLPIFQ